MKFEKKVGFIFVFLLRQGLTIWHTLSELLYGSDWPPTFHSPASISLILGLHACRGKKLKSKTIANSPSSWEASSPPLHSPAVW